MESKTDFEESKISQDSKEEEFKDESGEGFVLEEFEIDEEEGEVRSQWGWFRGV